MHIDPTLVALIVGPILDAVVGVWGTRLFEKGPKLIYYYGHASAFLVRETDPHLTIHTHSVVIRNAGRLSAHNVRLAHNLLPQNVALFPPREHRIDREQNEICISLMVPGDLVTVSYLYQPPLYYNQTNTTVRSDEGFGIAITALPTRQWSKNTIRLLQVLLFLGGVFALYLIAELGIYIAHARLFLPPISR